MKPRTGAVFLILALLANLLLTSILNVRVAYACSCALSPIKEEIQRSDAVFSGKVQSIEEDRMLADGGSPSGMVTLAVHESWKGVSAESVSVHGQGDGMNCYTMFEKDETYLVYASRKGEGDDAPLQNDVCAATKPLEAAEADLGVLGSPAEDLPDTGGIPLPILGAAAIALVLAGGLIVRRGGGNR